MYCSAPAKFNYCCTGVPHVHPHVVRTDTDVHRRILHSDCWGGNLLAYVFANNVVEQRSLSDLAIADENHYLKG